MDYANGVLVMHKNWIWTRALEIQIWKQMHVWWHKAVFISITKNATRREEDGHAGRQLQTDVKKQPLPTHRADLGAQEGCLICEWGNIGTQTASVKGNFHK